jgi:hypothetical protein
VQNLTTWARVASVVRPPNSIRRGKSMKSLKVRALPYVGVLTFIAALSGSFTGR